MASGEMGAMGAAPTPLILEDTREASRCGQVFGKSTSWQWLIAYKDYRFHLDEWHQIGVPRRERITPTHLMPIHMKIVFARKYAGG